VLAAQYESWTSAAAVIPVVPTAMIRVLLALMARGFENNLYTEVGLVPPAGLDIHFSLEHEVGLGGIAFGAENEIAALEAHRSQHSHERLRHVRGQRVEGAR